MREIQLRDSKTMVRLPMRDRGSRTIGGRQKSRGKERIMDFVDSSEMSERETDTILHRRLEGSGD